MSFGATGSFLFRDSAALTLSNQGVGNLLLVEVLNYSNNTVDCTGLSGGGATWTLLGSPFRGTSNPWSASLFMGTVTATGAQTATPTWSGSAPGGYEINGHEFTSSAGSWALDGSTGTIDSPGGTNSFPSLTPSHNGELYFGFAGSSSSVAGSTPGYVYNVNSDGDATAYNLSCPAGIATFPVWGSTDELMGIAALIQETGAATPAAQPPPPLIPPGFQSPMAFTAFRPVPNSSTTVTRPAAAALTGSGTLSVPGVTLGYAAALSGTGSLTAAAATTRPRSASLSGTGTLSVPGVTLGYSATLAGTGSLTVPGVTLGYKATLSGSGSLSVPGVTLGYSASLSGSGSLSATRAGAGIAFRDKNVPGLSTASTIVATVPLTVQAGDSVLIYVTNYGVASNAITVSSTGTTPAQVDQRAGGNGISTHSLWWFTAGPGDAGASITFTQGTATYIGAVLLAYSSASPVQPDVFTHGDTNGGNVTPWVAPTAVTLTDGDWGVYFATGVGGGGDETTSYDGGTARGQDSTTGLSGFDSNGPVGAAGTTIGGGNWTAVAGSESWYGYTVGLRPKVTQHPSATLTGSGTLSVSGETLGYSAALSGSGSLSVPGVTLGYAAALTGTGSLAVPGVVLGYKATLTGSGTPAAGWQFAPFTTLSGTGSLSVPGVRLGYTASLSGSGTLSVPGVVLGYAAALTGTGLLAASYTHGGTINAGAHLSGTGSLSTVTVSPFRVAKSTAAVIAATSSAAAVTRPRTGIAAVTRPRGGVSSVS